MTYYRPEVQRGLCRGEESCWILGCVVGNVCELRGVAIKMISSGDF